MSTEETETGAGIPSLFDQHNGVDWLLAHIVKLADAGLEMSMTISAEGQLLTGTLIGGRQYFEELSAAILSTRSSTPEQKAIIETLANGFGAFKAVYPEKEAAADDESKPSFLHLRGATPVLNTDSIRGAGALFRVQLAKISAFTLSATTFTRS